MDIVNNAAITSDLTWSGVGEGWRETLAGNKKEDSRFTYFEGVHKLPHSQNNRSGSVAIGHTPSDLGMTSITRANV